MNLKHNIEITPRIGCSNVCEYCPQSTLIKRYRERIGADKDTIMTLETFKKCLSTIPLHVGLNLTGYVKLMGLITGVSRSGGVNDTWLTFNGMNSSGNYSWVRTYLDNSNDTSTNRSGTSTGYAYGSVGPGFFINLAGIAAADSGNIDAEFTVHNLQESGRKIFTMTSRSYLVRYMVIDTRGSINTTSAITSFAINVSNAVSRNTGGTIKFYGVK